MRPAGGRTQGESAFLPVRPPTGEPDAEEAHARFGGGASHGLRRSTKQGGFAARFRLRPRGASGGLTPAVAAARQSAPLPTRGLVKARATGGHVSRSAAVGQRLASDGRNGRMPVLCEVTAFLHPYASPAVPSRWGPAAGSRRKCLADNAENCEGARDDARHHRGASDGGGGA